MKQTAVDVDAFRSYLREHGEVFFKTNPRLPLIAQYCQNSQVQIFIVGRALRTYLITGYPPSELDICVVLPRTLHVDVFRAKLSAYLKMHEQNLSGLNIQACDDIYACLSSANLSLDAIAYDILLKDVLLLPQTAIDYATKSLHFLPGVFSNPAILVEFFVTAASYQLKIDDESILRIRRYKQMLWALPPNEAIYVWGHLFSLFSQPFSGEVLQALQKSQILETWIPELTPLVQANSSVTQDVSQMEFNFNLLQRLSETYLRLSYSDKDKLLFPQSKNIRLPEGETYRLRYNYWAEIRVAALLFQIAQVHSRMMPTGELSSFEHQQLRYKELRSSLKNRLKIYAGIDSILTNALKMAHKVSGLMDDYQAGCLSIPRFQRKLAFWAQQEPEKTLCAKVLLHILLDEFAMYGDAIDAARYDELKRALFRD